MFQKNRGLIFTGIAVLFFIIVFLNKDYFVMEHLVNITTTKTLKKELDKTNKNVAKLEKELKDMNEKAGSQAGAAAAAQAQLAAMN
jgi:cell division protein FtsB